jgi:hypothetical protein
MKKVFTPKTKKEKDEQHRFFFWYKKENQAWIRNTLQKVGRNDLVEKLLFTKNKKEYGKPSKTERNKKDKKGFVSVLDKSARKRKRF